MTDDKRNASDESAAGPVAGERLAEARRLRQISLPDVARQLHLDEPRVQALEENRFDALGAPVFAKGYLRKYAKLVGASIDDIMADYYTLNRATGAPPVVGPPRKHQRVIDPARWIARLLAVIVVIAAAYAAYWWYVARSADAVPQAVTGTRLPVQPAPAERPVLQDERRAAASPQASAPAPADADADAGNAGAREPAVVETAPAQRAAPPPPPATGTGVELRLAFSGDCWTEVTDGGGARLFFDLGTAGRTVTVHGAPPLRVLVGNEENVSLSVNGTPYAITSANRRGNTARFSISP